MPPTCCGTAVTWAEDALPPALCARIVGLFGLEELPDTVSEAAAAVRPAADPRAHPAVEEALDDASTDHRHEVETESGRTGVSSVADALALLSLAGEEGVVHSHDPVTGEAVALRLDADGVDCDPPGAVVAFGAGPDVWSGETVTAELIRRSVVPFVHLFGSRRSYWRWAAATDEPVVALSPAAAQNVGRVLAGEPHGVTPAVERFPLDDPEPAIACGPPRTTRRDPGPPHAAPRSRLDDAVATSDRR
jgi:hypothetical protein